MTLRDSHWSLYFICWVAAISAVGAALGGLSFPLLGLLLGWDFSLSELCLNGMRNLGFLFFVWAVPIAIIACFARWYRRRSPQV